jgi:hypothetical protein
MQRRDLVRQQPEHGMQTAPWLARLVSAGIVSTDKDVVRRQRCVNIAVFATAANSASHLIFNAVYDFQGLAPAAHLQRGHDGGAAVHSAPAPPGREHGERSRSHC